MTPELLATLKLQSGAPVGSTALFGVFVWEYILWGGWCLVAVSLCGVIYNVVALLREMNAHIKLYPGYDEQSNGKRNQRVGEPYQPSRNPLLVGGQPGKQGARFGYGLGNSSRIVFWRGFLWLIKGLSVNVNKLLLWAERKVVSNPFSESVIIHSGVGFAPNSINMRKSLSHNRGSEESENGTWGCSIGRRKY
jgi:hypothetical protein